MQELLSYNFLTWPTFYIVILIAGVVSYLAHRFHFFTESSWKSSIKYHMFFLVLISIVVMTFILVRPFPNSILLIVVGSFFYKSILSYTKVVFSLYFSGIRMGDRVKVGDISGMLTNINFGGIHLLSDHNKVFFPFNQWVTDKIILESQEGRVPVFMECVDTVSGRNPYNSIEALERGLFAFPYLDPTELIIQKSDKKVTVTTGIANLKHEGSLKSRIEKEGFSITNKKNN